MERREIAGGSSEGAETARTGPAPPEGSLPGIFCYNSTETTIHDHGRSQSCFLLFLPSSSSSPSISTATEERCLEGLLLSPLHAGGNESFTHKSCSHLPETTTPLLSPASGWLLDILVSSVREINQLSEGICTHQQLPGRRI